MGIKYQLKYLTKEFYDEYNSKQYPEIEHKPERPYMVFLVTVDNNTYAIPFRTNVKHKYCYKFKNSSRDTKYSTGLDYSKAVIVNDARYVGQSATIDNKEYVELNNKYYFIIKQFKSYVQGYIRFVNCDANEFEARKYRFSTLQYFHKELKLKQSKMKMCGFMDNQI